jgi:hypothetical protein
MRVYVKWDSELNGIIHFWNVNLADKRRSLDQCSLLADQSHGV